MSAVSILADILAEESISIYYVSTFTTDFVLVIFPPYHLSLALSLLSPASLANSGFSVTG